MLPNPGALVYGTITVGALLAAESAKRETYAETVGAVVIALLIYWLAHAYSDFAEHRLERRAPFKFDGLARTLAHEVVILVGAGIPLLALLLCWIAGAPLTTGVTTAIWTSAGTLVGIEVIAGLRAHLSGRALLGQTAVGALFGLLVIALKLVLH